MPIERSPDGTIVNARDLVAEEVIGERVLCPACSDKVFQVWPEGWDAHSVFRCVGIRGSTQEEKKANFKQRFHYLFR